MQAYLSCLPLPKHIQNYNQLQFTVSKPAVYLSPFSGRMNCADFPLDTSGFKAFKASAKIAKISIDICMVTWYFIVRFKLCKLCIQFEISQDRPEDKLGVHRPYGQPGLKPIGNFCCLIDGAKPFEKRGKSSIYKLVTL